MAALFYNLGKMLGPKVRKGKWVWKSLTASTDDSIVAEREVGLDIASSIKRTMTFAPAKEQKLACHSGRKLAKKIANKKMKFNFFVYIDQSPNAFAVPGGFVFISSSLLDLYRESQDMAAFVIAHEMGHITRKHAVNRLINSMTVSAVTRALPAKGRIASVIKNTGLKFFQSAYSQSQELEADAFGLKLMTAAGFDPKAAPKALKKLDQCHQKGERSIKDEYFSTHPETSKRIDELKALLE